MILEINETTFSESRNDFFCCLLFPLRPSFGLELGEVNDWYLEGAGRSKSRETTFCNATGRGERPTDQHHRWDLGDGVVLNKRREESMTVC